VTTMLINTVRDLDSGVTTVSLQGELTVSTAPGVRSALAKSAAECPTAVVVDLNGLERTAGGLGSLLATASQSAAKTWGVPLVLYGAQDDAVRELRPFRQFNPVYRTRWDALNALRAWVPRWWHIQLAPAPASAARARHMVADTLVGWRLSHLVDAAGLIVSELTGNAVEHAAVGDFDLTLVYTTLYVRIAVQDRSPMMPYVIAQPVLAAVPRPAMQGWGLRIVAETATHWGTVAVPNGKIVYALLRAHPLPAPVAEVVR
jgi:anti-anti-sigma regulatory factor